MKFSRTTPIALLLVLALAGCGGGGDSSPATPNTPTTPAPATDITLAASGSEVTPGGAAIALTATLNGSGSVTWQLANGSVGSLSATTGASVNYLPPASNSQSTTVQVTITATSGGLTRNITLSLLPDAVRTGLSLLAGSTAGQYIQDGTGGAARLSTRDFTIDAAGNFYLADQVGLIGLVRKVTPAGVVSKVVDAVRNALPISVAAAPDGSLYFLDYSQYSLTGSIDEYAVTLRKLSTDGTLSTVLSFERNTAFPYAMVDVGANGTVYLKSSYHVGVLENGAVRVLAGGSRPGTQDGTGAGAGFSGLSDMAVGTDGNLYVIDVTDVRKVTPAGVVTTVAKGGALDVQDGDTGSASLQSPSSLTAGRDGALYVIDRPTSYQTSSYSAVRKISEGKISTLFKLRESAPATPELQILRAGADGTLFASSRSELVRLAADGSYQVIAGKALSTETVDGVGAAASYINPGMLASDQDGNVYSVEYGGPFGFQSAPLDHRLIIRKTTPLGVVSTFANIAMDGIGGASGIVIDRQGRLLVSVRGRQFPGGTIHQVEAGNKLTLIAGTPVSPTIDGRWQRDGVGAAASFGGPVIVGLDDDNNLYVSDYTETFESQFRKITPAGQVTSMATLPAGVGVAPDGYIYSARDDASSVWRKRPGGTDTLVAGGTFGNGLGALPGQLYHPTSVVYVAPGVLVVNSGSALVRIVLPR